MKLPLVLSAAAWLAAVSPASAQVPIETFQATAKDATVVTVEWTSPYVWDYWTGNPLPSEGYEIRLSAAGPIASIDAWTAAEMAAISSEPLTPGKVEQVDLKGLRQGTKYWFAIRAGYGGVPGQVSPAMAPVTTLLDVVPPAVIGDGRLTGAGYSTLDFAFSAVGDDALAGIADRYDIRLSDLHPASYPSFEDWYAAAQPVPGRPLPPPAGSALKIGMTNLHSGTTYWVAARAYDEVGNPGPLPAVIPQGTTLPDDGIDHGAGDSPCGSSGAAGTCSLAGLLASLGLLRIRPNGPAFRL